MMPSTEQAEESKTDRPQVLKKKLKALFRKKEQAPPPVSNVVMTKTGDKLMFKDMDDDGGWTRVCKYDGDDESSGSVTNDGITPDDSISVDPTDVFFGRNGPKSPTDKSPGNNNVIDSATKKPARGKTKVVGAHNDSDTDEDGNKKVKLARPESSLDDYEDDEDISEGYMHDDTLDEDEGDGNKQAEEEEDRRSSDQRSESLEREIAAACQTVNKIERKRKGIKGKGKRKITIEKRAWHILNRTELVLVSSPYR